LFSYSCISGVGPQSCQKGTYSTPGQTSCTSCPKGYQCPTQNITSPIPCPLGTYSNETNTFECLDCPAGYECSDTSKTPVECVDGTYSLSKRSECVQCPAGKK